MSLKAIKKTLEIEDIIAEPGRRVYVMNTAQHVLKQRTDVLIPHTSSNGREVTIVVPSTFIPINVAIKASKEELLNSPYFLEAVNNGILTLVGTEEAQVLLKDAAARREIDRLHQERFSGMPVSSTDDSAPEQANEPDSAALLDVMEREDVKTNERINFLRNLEPTLTKKDIEWALSKTTEAKEVEFLTRCLKKLQEDDA